MSEEIIKVLNYIGEKLGIVIDWTAENALPQVMDILGRYRLFELISAGIWLAVEMCMIIATAIVLSKALKAYYKFYDTKEDNFWWENCCGASLTDEGMVLMMLFVVIGVIGIVLFSIDMSEMLKWFFVPEIKYLELLKGYTQ